MRRSPMIKETWDRMIRFDRWMNMTCKNCESINIQYRHMNLGNQVIDRNENA